MNVLALTPAQRRLVAAVVLAGIAALLGFRYLLAPSPRSPARAAPAIVRAAPKPAARLVVDVVGAVRRPGLYRLQQGTRIADAVALAGGATPKADLAQVNLAAPLADGEQVVVPARDAVAPAAGAAPAVPGAPTAPVDLNTATPEQLDALPGIGPTTAAKIVAYRQAHGPFHSLAELDAVPGIGPARIEQLKGLAIP